MKIAFHLMLSFGYRSESDASSDVESETEETDKKAKTLLEDFDDDGEPIPKDIPKTKNEIDVCSQCV